jgi:DNA topoisomerase-2
MLKTNKLLNKSIEKSYIKLSPIEHVLKKPGMYIGDLDFRTEKQFIYKNNTLLASCAKHDCNTIIQDEISWSPGLYKIVDELIVNVYDQTIRDKTLSIISVTLNSDFFSIFNDGIGIDVVLHPTHKIYVPELIFANLLTSTNYDENEQRITGGTHGLGAKLSAIFSKKFTIQVWDATRKLYYYQTFENNLSKISKPIIKKYNKVSDILDINNNLSKSKGGLLISIEPDFEKFKTDKFSDNMIQLLSRRVIDLIGLVREKVYIYLNGNEIKRLNEFESYLNLYKSEQPWIISHCVKNQLWSFAIRFNDGKSIDFGTQISFVNGIFTNRSGKHVDYIYDLLLEKFQKLIGPDFTKKILYDYVTLCLKSSIVNPTFNSQTKEELNTPVTKFGTTANNIPMGCIIPDSFWNQIKNSPIISQLKHVLSFSNQKILAKFDGTKKNKIKNLPKLEDANFAGTKKSNECVLILTEGDSAKATAISGISAIQSGRNYYGVYPLRGKLLNVREASINQINKNQEIIDIKKILGLKSGQTYNSSNINELRYGSVMIMTDADEDGSHIKGLIINFFDYFYPSLLEINGFMKILVTPLVKATNAKNTSVLNFANLRAYGIWKEKTSGSENWKIKYYKGLGTSTSKEAGEYFKNIKLNTIDIIQNASSGKNPDILLAFAKEKIPDRKIWLSNYNPDNILQLEPPSTITIKQFIHQELIHFSNYDNIRSIPSIADGFKPSQRKVIYACLKRNLTGESKVAQLAASVAELSAYHHGEQSLVSTIINMAQNFVGTNNLNLLSPQGQFGTRLMGGKDHSSARYIYTMLESYVNKIFIKIDSELLEYLDDDGYKIEPKYYIPIIPLILINGAEGIGTGFSTSIPTFNPIDIIKWLENKLNGKQNKIKLIPYYKGFTGTIIKYDDSLLDSYAKHKTNTLLDSYAKHKTNSTWLSCGVLTINYKTHELIISELPIKLWTNDYKEWLEELIYESKIRLFKSYINLSSDIGINFILKFTEDTSKEIKRMENTIDSNGLCMLYKYLHLYKTIKQSNMNLYTVNYSIKTFKTAEEILDEFYSWRLTFYDKRRDLLLKKCKDEISYINNQIKFIELVIKNNGKIFKMDPIQMNKYMETNKIGKIDNSYDYLTNMTFKQLTKVNLLKLNEKLNQVKNLYKNIESKSNKKLWLEDLAELNSII